MVHSVLSIGGFPLCLTGNVTFKGLNLVCFQAVLSGRRRSCCREKRPHKYSLHPISKK